MLSNCFKSSLKLKGISDKIMQLDSAFEFFRETGPIGYMYVCIIYYVYIIYNDELPHRIIEMGKSNISRTRVPVQVQRLEAPDVPAQRPSGRRILSHLGEVSFLF